MCEDEGRDHEDAGSSGASPVKRKRIRNKWIRRADGFHWYGPRMHGWVGYDHIRGNWRWRGNIYIFGRRKLAIDVYMMGEENRGYNTAGDAKWHAAWTMNRLRAALTPKGRTR